MTVHLNVVWTIIAALFAIQLGRRLNRLFVWFERASVPPSVTAGLLLSLILAGLRAEGWIDIRLDTAPRDVLLLVFFSSLGFGAHLSRIAMAGRGALVICLGIVLVITVQNVVGIAIAHAFGDSPLLGVFLGSAAYAGGHGTVVAWASTPLGTATPGAFEIGIGSATLGLVFGGLVAGPVSVWLATRDRSAARHSTVFANDEAREPERESAFSTDRWLPCLLWMALSVAVAESLMRMAAGLELKTPAFLAVLLISVVITNVADLAKRPIDTEVTDLVGTVALRIFLAIAMLSLNWGELMVHLPMLLTAAVAQVVATVAVAALVVYTLFGRGPEGAAATGAFIGMSLGAMPVGLAVMRRMSIQFGETPRALLAVTLAAALFTDTANALGITAFIRWIAL
jgi:ESS family glutamate:Na+ symporter